MPSLAIICGQASRFGSAQAGALSTRRSAVASSTRATTANIAEGYGRFHYLDNAKFCSNARGSCWETLDHLITGSDEGFVATELLNQGRTLVNEAVKVLNGYMSYLKRAHRTRPATNNE